MTINMTSPTFVLESSKLKKNLSKIQEIEEKTDVKILHTLKSFHHKDGLELMDAYIDGYSMGNLNEHDYISDMGAKHIHTYAPYIYPQEIYQLSKLSHTMSFNSIKQWQDLSQEASKNCSVGLRINPKLNIKQPKYCDANLGVRLGIVAKAFWSSYDKGELAGLDGLHFHALSSSGVDGLKYLISHIQKEYKEILPKLKWLNLGGGHSFASDDYDTDEFCLLVNAFKETYPHLELVFEPGEGLLVDAGYFSTTILDIIPDSTPVVILDTSIEAHLLDIAITKQKPKIKGSSVDGNFSYIISGMSCIAGDIIGKYSFAEPLQIGDRVIFEDMISYTLVKQTDYNGIKSTSFVIV